MNADAPLLDTPDARAAWQPVFVWLVWAVFGGAALGLVIAYGMRLPYSDDWNMVPFVTGTDPVTLRWLWAQHNEHRIVLIKLAFVWLPRLAGGDYRSLIALNIALLAATAAAVILALRTLRGRTTWVDAVYPALLLSYGLSADQWGFELQFTLVTVVVVAISLVFLRSGPAFTWRGSLFAGLLLICLPISGGSGLAFVPGIAGWMIVRALCQIAFHPGPRTAPVIAIASAVLGIALSAAYFIGFATIPHPWPNPNLQQFLTAFVKLPAAGLGALSNSFSPLLPIVAAVFVAVSLVHVCIVALDRDGAASRRWQAADLAAFTFAFIPVALSVAYGRGGQGWLDSNHYSTLALPVLVWSSMGWSLAKPALPVRLLQAATLVTAGAFGVAYLVRGAESGPHYLATAAAAAHDLRDGLPAETIAGRHLSKLYFIDLPETRRLVRDGIGDLRAAGYRAYGPPIRQ